MSKTQDARQEELDLEPEAAEDETKAEAWTRLANYRMAAAIKRLRMIRRLTGPNYQYDADQAKRLVSYLRSEVDAIQAALVKEDEPEPVPQL